MNNIETLSAASKALRLYNLSKSVGRVLMEAQQEKPSYSEFLKGILTMELEGREKRDFERRLSAACLPARHDLEQFDFNYSCGITKPQMKELHLLHIRLAILGKILFIYQDVHYLSHDVITFR